MSGKLHEGKLPYAKHMSFSFLRTGRFWIATIVALIATGLLFAWEMNLLENIGLTGPPRYEPTTREMILTSVITLLFSLNVGLLVWSKRYGVCPVGSKRATGAAGAFGFLALICPVCVLWSVGFLGLSLSLAFLTPFVPLIQVVAIILLGVNLFLLLPKNTP